MVKIGYFMKENLKTIYVVQIYYLLCNHKTLWI